jgi:hypothetical protein
MKPVQAGIVHEGVKEPNAIAPKLKFFFFFNPMLAAVILAANYK